MNKKSHKMINKLKEVLYPHRHLFIWGRNTFRFELFYRLLMIIVLHPLINFLLNYYINNTSYASSLTNFNIFYAFLTPVGMLIVLIITLIALLAIVFELLTLTAMTYCMIKKIDYTVSSLYSSTYAHLKALWHPSSLLAPIYFIGLLPLTHIGYISSYLTNFQIPNFITNELSLTVSGRWIIILFFLFIFILYGLSAFVPLFLFRSDATFWKACKKSFCTVGQMPRKYQIRLSLLIIFCLLCNLSFFHWVPIPILKNSDFNIYLFRYLFHSYHFRIQLLCTISYWFFLYILSMFFLICILCLYEKVSSPLTIEIKEEFPSFILRFSAKLKRSAITVSSRLWNHLQMFSHRWAKVWLLCPFMIIVMFFYLDQKPLFHSPWVIGHRGDGHAPENSLAGIQSAYEHGSDYAEIDIQLTKDNQLIVFHDTTTARLSNHKLAIADHTLQQLQNVDLISRNQHYTMPSLQEAIDAAKTYDASFGLLIELKPAKGKAAEMVQALIQLIEDNHFEERAIFMSMDYEAVTLLQQQRPDWWTGYCIFGSLGKIDQRLQVDFLAIEEGLANTRFLEQARNNGIPVYIWTVDDYYAVLNYLRMGVSGIIGDNVQDIRYAVNDYEQRNDETYVYQGRGYPKELAP